MIIRQKSSKCKNRTMIAKNKIVTKGDEFGKSIKKTKAQECLEGQKIFNILVRTIYGN